MKNGSSILFRIVLTGFTIAILTTRLIAQLPCSDEGIMNTKGSWKKDPDANVSPGPSFPKAQLPQLIGTINKLQILLQAAYPEPKGMEAKWYRSISGSPIVKAGPEPYSLNSLFLAYYCNELEKKIEPGGETGTWFYVWANQLNSWFAEYIDIYIIQKQPVYLLPKKVGILNSYPLYEGNYNRTRERYSRAIVVPRNGQSPYIPVTQKQFLKAFLNYNEKGFIKDLAFQKNRTIKTDAEEEIDIKENMIILERITRPDKLVKAKEDYLRNRVTDKQRKEGWIAETEKQHALSKKPARDLLADTLTRAMSESVILDFDNLLTFKEFSTEEKGGRELVRLNPEYFNMTLPKYVPQLFIVHWSWDDRTPGRYWREQIEKNFNFKALQAMLDK